MAWKVGDACGLTLTLSGASRCAKYRAVMTVTRLALEAWWPPTLRPSPVSRLWLAASMMRVASHSTRCWIVSRTSGSAPVGAITAVVSAMPRSSARASADAGPAVIAVPASRVVNVGHPGRRAAGAAVVTGGRLRPAGNRRHAHSHQRLVGAALPAQRREQRAELVGRVDLHPVHLPPVLAVVPDQHVADGQRGVRHSARRHGDHRRRDGDAPAGRGADLAAARRADEGD